MIEILQKVYRLLEISLRNRTEFAEAELKALAYIQGAEAQRTFLSGKVQAYQETLRIIEGLK